MVSFRCGVARARDAPYELLEIKFGHNVLLRIAP